MILGTNEILIVFFFVFQSLRVKYYKQGDRVSETELAKGLQLLRWYRKKANLHNNWRTFRYNLLFLRRENWNFESGTVLSKFLFVFYLRLEMLEYSDERRPWESMEEKLTLIRFVIYSVVFISSSLYSSLKNSI